MRHGLRAIDQHRHAVFMRNRDHFADRRDRAQCVRNMGHRHELRIRVEQLAIVLDQQFATVIDGHHANLRAPLFRDHLPGHDVRVMLQRGQDDLVAGIEELPAVTLRHQIDAVGGAAGENALTRFGGIDEGLHLVPCLFIFSRRGFRQVMHRAVNIGVLRAAVFHPALDDRLRHLTGGCIIQENQWLAIDLQAQDRKLAAQCGDIQRRNQFVARAHMPTSVRAITSFSSTDTNDGTGM